MRASSKKIVGIFAILLLYSFVYFVYAGIFPWQFGRQLVGDYNSDMSQFLWNAFHFGEWFNGRQPFRETDLLFAPHGTSLAYHTYSPLLASVSHFMGNAFLGINIILWLHAIFSGLGAFLVARYCKLNLPWAILAGFIFAFVPYKFAHYNGHFNLQQTAFIPFFVLAFFKTFPADYSSNFWSKFTPKRFIILLGISFLCLLSSYVYSAFLLMFGVGYVIYYCYFRYIKKPRRRIIIFIILVIAASLLIPYLNHLGFETHGAFWWRDDIGKYLTPNWNNAFYQQYTSFLYKQHSRLGLKHNDSFLGFSFLLFFVVILVLYFLKKMKQPLQHGSTYQAQLLAFLAFFFFMLTCPEIIIFNTKIGYLPTAIYHFIPALNNLRIPERFAIMFTLFLSIFIFVRAQKLFDPNPIFNRIIPLLLLVCLLVEYSQNPFSFSKKNDIPSWVFLLQKQPPGNVLTLPMGIRDGNENDGHFENKQLYYQTVHRHKLVGGYISRINETLRTSYRAQKGMKKLFDLSEQAELKDSITGEDINSILTDFEAQYLVVDNSKIDLVKIAKQYFEPISQRKLTSEQATIYCF